MPEPADPIAALVAMLKADGPTASLVGGRVFGAELPPAETAAMPRRAIVLAPSGGPSLTGGSYAEHDAQRVDLFAYGATPSEADAVRRAAARALRRVRRGVWAGVLIHWVRSAGGFSLARDPDAAWPRSFQSFQVFHALEEV
jgi:hypothetical protein